MKKGPHKLATDIFEAKFEMSVLINGVVAAKKRGCADLQPLLVSDFFRSDDARRVTGARRGDCRIVRMREVISQCDTWRGSFKLHAVRLRRSHRLRCHRVRALLEARQNNVRAPLGAHQNNFWALRAVAIALWRVGDLKPSK